MIAVAAMYTMYTIRGSTKLSFRHRNAVTLRSLPTYQNAQGNKIKYINGVSNNLEVVHIHTFIYSSYFWAKEKFQSNIFKVLKHVGNANQEFVKMRYRWDNLIILILYVILMILRCWLCLTSVGVRHWNFSGQYKKFWCI